MWYFFFFSKSPRNTITYNSEHDFEKALALLKGDMVRAERLAKQAADTIWTRQPEIEIVSKALIQNSTLSNWQIDELFRPMDLRRAIERVDKLAARIAQ